MNSEAVHASPRKTGMIILGGGLPKHHICNANMMRNGADFAVFINTAQEFDGSDSGARPDEAVSWGKIRGSAKTVKVKPVACALIAALRASGICKNCIDFHVHHHLYHVNILCRRYTVVIILFKCICFDQVHCDATIAFPLLVAETFAARIKNYPEAKP